MSKTSLSLSLPLVELFIALELEAGFQAWPGPAWRDHQKLPEHYPDVYDRMTYMQSVNSCKEPACDAGYIHYEHPMKPGVCMNSGPCPRCNADDHIPCWQILISEWTTKWSITTTTTDVAAAETITTAAPVAPAPSTTPCPNCGEAMVERKCKLVCTKSGCGYFLSCSDLT